MIGNSGIVNAGIVHAAVFTCSICGEPSTNICAYCTKDACANHRCERCKRCSDCCECEVPLSAEEAVPELVAETVAEVTSPVAESVFAEPLEPAEPDESPYLFDQKDRAEQEEPTGRQYSTDLHDPTEPLV